MNQKKAPNMLSAVKSIDNGQLQDPGALFAQRRQFGQWFAAAAVGLTAGLSGCQQPEAPAVGGKLLAPPRPKMKIRSSLIAFSGTTSSASEAQGEKLTEIFNQISSQMHGFTTGNTNSSAVIYAVVDPMCSHCAKFWIASQNLLNSYKFVWIPVPLLGQDSLINGALILSAKDPADAMNVHEYKLLNQLPLINPAPESVEAGRPKMEHNNSIAKAIRIESVPFILVKKKIGEIVSTVGGIGAGEIVELVNGPIPAQASKPLRPIPN